jgi:hypothetical protein
VKKHCTAVLIALCAAASLAAQTDTSAVGMINLNGYSSYFLDKNRELDVNYELASTDFDYYDKVATLGGSQTLVDTPLEIALLSYSAGVIDVRPVEADVILPKNNPKLSDLKLGAAVYQEMQLLRFLGNTDAVGRHEGMIKFITDRGNVNRAEIERYYQQGIGTLIAEAVNAEFNKIGFTMENKVIRKGYNVVLIHAANNQYILEYEGVYQGKDFGDKFLPVNSLEALLSAMSSRSADFDQNCINTVRTQAALIPAVALAQTGTMDAVMGTVKKALTDFYLNPTTTNYNTVKDISSLFTRRAYEYHQDPLFEIIRSSYDSVLSELSRSLVSKVDSDTVREKYAAASLTQAQIRALTVPRGGAR